MSEQTFQPLLYAISADVVKRLVAVGDTLHCQSDNATIAEIDDFIKTQTP